MQTEQEKKLNVGLTKQLYDWSTHRMKAACHLIFVEWNTENWNWLLRAIQWDNKTKVQTLITGGKVRISYL